MHAYCQRLTKKKAWCVLGEGCQEKNINNSIPTAGRGFHWLCGMLLSLSTFTWGELGVLHRCLTSWLFPGCTVLTFSPTQKTKGSGLTLLPERLEHLFCILRSMRTGKISKVFFWETRVLPRTLCLRIVSQTWCCVVGIHSPKAF